MSDAMDTPEGALPSIAGESTFAVETSESRPPSRMKKIFKTLGWINLGLFFLILFTILKLPEDRIRNFVQGSISSQLSGMGVTLTAAQSRISIGMGLSYTMKDVTLSPPPPQDPIKIEQISISPSILKLLTGKLGGSLRLENKGGYLTASFAQPIGSSSSVDFSFEGATLDLGSLGVFPLTAGLKGSAIANGEGRITGDLNVPTSLEGEVHVDLSKIVIDQQALMGFSIPRLAVSEGKADIVITGGKAQIKTLRLGKTGNAADDIRANFTGDITLGKNWQFSTLNLKASFSLSDTLKKAFPLLDAILGAGKQADGSYSYNIGGSVSAPNPVPVPAGGA